MACQELLWLPRNLEQRVTPINTAIPVLSANQCAIDLAVGERCPSGHAKHIDIKIQFSQDGVKCGISKVKMSLMRTMMHIYALKHIFLQWQRRSWRDLVSSKNSKKSLGIDTGLMAWSPRDIIIQHLETKFRFTMCWFQHRLRKSACTRVSNAKVKRTYVWLLQIQICIAADTSVLESMGK